MFLSSERAGRNKTIRTFCIMKDSLPVREIGHFFSETLLDLSQAISKTVKVDLVKEHTKGITKYRRIRSREMHNFRYAAMTITPKYSKDNSISTDLPYYIQFSSLFAKQILLHATIV